MDVAAKSDIKLTSVLVLVAKVLMRNHQQLPDLVLVSRNEAGQVLLLLGLLTKIAYDQFARMSMRSMISIRETVVSSIRWSSLRQRQG